NFSLRTGVTACNRLVASENVATMTSLSMDHLRVGLFFLRVLIVAEADLVRAVAGDALDLPHRDHGQEADEQREQREEEAEAADQDREVELGWIEHAPARRQEVAVQADDDDYEALEPHADVDHDGDHEQHR